MYPHCSWDSHSNRWISIYTLHEVCVLKQNMSNAFQILSHHFKAHLCMFLVSTHQSIHRSYFFLLPPFNCALLSMSCPTYAHPFPFPSSTSPPPPSIFFLITTITTSGFPSSNLCTPSFILPAPSRLGLHHLLSASLPPRSLPLSPLYSNLPFSHLVFILPSANPSTPPPSLCPCITPSLPLIAPSAAGWQHASWPELQQGESQLRLQRYWHEAPLHGDREREVSDRLSYAVWPLGSRQICVFHTWIMCGSLSFKELQYMPDCTL